MLLRITAFRDIDERRLMDVYAESNAENALEFFPDEADRAAALRQVEDGFLDYLKTGFFRRPEASYWILSEDGVWLCALRSCRVAGSLYYLEALETRPDSRGQGCAERLLSGVLDVMKKEGPFRLCCSVGKKNAASLRAHEACGFQIVSDEGWDYLRDTANPRSFGLAYRYYGA